MHRLYAPAGTTHLAGSIANLVDSVSCDFCTNHIHRAGVGHRAPASRTSYQYVISVADELEAVGIAEPLQNWLLHVAVVGVGMRRHDL